MRPVVACSAVLLLSLAAPAGAQATSVRCDNVDTRDLAVDGLLDDWPKAVLARAGIRGDGLVLLRCSWDGTALAMSLEIEDDRVIRIKGGHEDHVRVSIGAGKKPVVLDVFPASKLAKSKIVKPAKIAAADSLQPKGFSVELRITAAQLAGLSPSTPSLDLAVTFFDSDAAAGGDTQEVAITGVIELGDREDLLDDFLRATKLTKADVRLDTLAELDPDRKGTERIVAGGTVIGVLTDQFAFVSLPVAKPADVKKVELLPLGKGRLQIVAATVRQGGNGGSRDLLMLWTVWSGQLQPLAQLEIRKELGGNVLASTWKIAKGKTGPELVVTPSPAVGWTAETWNEAPAEDADPIVLPWDASKAGIAYTLRGAELERRDLPVPKKRR